jgi:Glycosyl transferase family 90
MRILQSYDEIMTVGKECLEKRTKNPKPAISGGMTKLPPQIDGPWEQSVEALEHTIKYVFEHLHHSCYFLCVTDGKPTIYKIVNRTTAPIFKTKIDKTLKQRKIKAKNKTWRVIQCVLKEHSKEEGTSIEWERFFNELPYDVPNGVYLLNLTDAVLLRKDNKEPWPMAGDKDLGNYKFSTHIPILGGSSQKGFHDIPIPNYDDVRIVLGYDKVSPSEIDWNTKKDVAVFRGTPTGCGTSTETNQRLKLATMKDEDLDVGVTSIPKNKFKYDPKAGLSTTKEVPTVPFMDMMKEQIKHKYIIHVDGNVAAYRLLKSMLTKSVILKVEGDYILWVDHLLQPMKHYVPVKADLSDLKEQLEWCRQNDSKAKKIAERGYKFALKALTKEYVFGSLAKIFWKV